MVEDGAVGEGEAYPVGVLPVARTPSRAAHRRGRFALPTRPVLVEHGEPAVPGHAPTVHRGVGQRFPLIDLTGYRHSSVSRPGTGPAYRRMSPPRVVDSSSGS